MRARILSLLVAGFVAVVGLVLLVGPVRTTDAQAGPIACGSVLNPDREGPAVGAPDLEVQMFDQLRAECTDRLASQAVGAWTTLGVGLAGCAVAGVWLASGRRTRVAQPVG